VFIKQNNPFLCGPSGSLSTAERLSVERSGTGHNDLCVHTFQAPTTASGQLTPAGQMRTLLQLVRTSHHHHHDTSSIIHSDRLTAELTLDVSNSDRNSFTS